LAQQSRFEEAEKEFREAVKLNPTYEPGYFHLGVTLSSEGEREKAAGRARTGGDARSPGCIGLVLPRNGSGCGRNPDEALRCFQQAGHAQA